MEKRLGIMRLRLKVEILTKYRSHADFTRLCSKREDWLSRIVHERIDPSDQDKRLIMDKLNYYSKDLFITSTAIET